jgi:hypothetical protein
MAIYHPKHYLIGISRWRAYCRFLKQKNSNRTLSTHRCCYLNSPCFLPIIIKLAFFFWCPELVDLMKRCTCIYYKCKNFNAHVKLLNLPLKKYFITRNCCYLKCYVYVLKIRQGSTKSTFKTSTRNVLCTHLTRFKYL